MSRAPSTTLDSSSRRIVIAGGSGFMGHHLVGMAQAAGFHPIVLSRSPEPSQADAGVTWRQWDNRTVGAWLSDLDGAAAVINLVGRSVDCRKTPVNRKVILESRLDSVRVLGEAVRRCTAPPPVWVQAGSAHIHGDPMPEGTLIDDNSPIGAGFAPEVCTQWEAAFAQARLPSQRGVILRTSFVLGVAGGALQRMITLTRWGLGGRLGSGRQYISWIHEHDMARLLLACVQDARFTGTYLVTSPNPVTNGQFMQTMRRVWRRPWSPPVPALAIRLGARFLLNTDPELALLGRRCVPARLLAQGFHFDWPDLEPALAEIRGRTA